MDTNKRNIYKYPNKLTLISFLLLGLIVLTTMGAYLLGVPQYYSLSTNAQKVTGTVISKERENHMAIWFEYSANGLLLISSGRAEDIGRTFNSIEIGETVPAVYDISNPSIAVLGEPRKYLYSSIRGTFFIFLGCGICILFYSVRRLSTGHCKSSSINED